MSKVLVDKKSLEQLLHSFSGPDHVLLETKVRHEFSARLKTSMGLDDPVQTLKSDLKNNES